MSVITIERKVLEKNDELARQNRALFGRTACSSSTSSARPAPARRASSKAARGTEGPLRIAVIEGDVQTDLDAQRVARYGVPVVQIVTNGGCHLEARLVRDALAAASICRSSTCWSSRTSATWSARPTTISARP